MQIKKSISFKSKAVLLMFAAAALLSSCENLISRTPREITGGGYSEVENSESGSLTVTARVSNGASRHAMPSIPELAYAALLYKDGKSSETFVQGTKATNSENLIFSFQKPRDTGGTFTLEIFAFNADTTNFSRNGALLSGSKIGCEIKNDAINVTDPIALSVNSASEVKGSVSLKIKVPTGCLLSISEIDENGVTVAENERHFTVTGTSPEFIVTQAGDGISAGAYQVTFTVKKGEEIVSIFSEYINVFPGMCTDTWDGSEKGAAKEITQSMISSTVYVRGEGGWYETSPYNETATARNENSGSFLSPLATIQKAIDKIIAINDGTSEYTIFVDGTLTATSSAALADFNGVSQSLSVKIAGLSASNKAILNGNDTARCVTVETVGEKKLNLTLENLVITNGNTTGRGGGIFFNGKTLEMTGCEVIGCEATDGGGGGIFIVAAYSK